MEIQRVALLGAGAVGAYFIWGLSEKMGDHFCVIASDERKEVFTACKGAGSSKRSGSAAGIM